MDEFIEDYDIAAERIAAALKGRGLDASKRIIELHLRYSAAESALSGAIEELGVRGYSTILRPAAYQEAVRHITEVDPSNPAIFGLNYVLS